MSLAPKLERMEGGYLHWCPGCEMHHRLPDAWKFDGNLEQPTFTPSFRHTFGKGMSQTCHYVLTAGVLHFCTDSTHAMAGQAVPLPVLPL